MKKSRSASDVQDHAAFPPEGMLDEETAKRLAERMGLLESEYAVIRKRLDRTPTHSELAVFSGMWSEHCSYKSTKHLLSTLPKDSPHVLAGPGAHAGVVSVGEGWAVAFKIESHNHPSAVEPYQGAATGVGGILRDVIAQGARPCALLDFLCFGSPDTADTKRIASGVVSGIGGYGNAIGVPIVGGRTHFDPAYEGNPLVNAMAVGLVRPHELRHARAQGVGNVLLLVGAATGRDGVLGAAFASEALGESSSFAQRRSHIQIGDPFSGKRLLEAILAFGPAQGLLAVQDLGACGIACASFEMAAPCGVGIDIQLDDVPLREPDLSPLEILLSETQERFALVIEEKNLATAIAHFQGYGLEAAAIGRITGSGLVRVFHKGHCHVSLPAQIVAGGAPKSDWPLCETPLATAPIDDVKAGDDKSHIECLLYLLSALSDPDPIYSRFDQTVGNRTVRGPGQAAAAVMRLPNSRRGFALTLTGDGNLCAADPYAGAQAALAESVRRLGCVGAELLAITDGLNFASPRDAKKHRQIVEVIRGLGDGLRTLGVPVTGGNVSLYNESPRGPIPPTPMIGGLGVIPDVGRVPVSEFRSGQAVFVLGHLSSRQCASRLARLLLGRPCGIPSVDLALEQRLARLVCSAISDRLICAASAVTAGGLATALAKMCLRSQCGIVAELPETDAPRWLLFGEHPAQALVSTWDDDATERLLLLARQHEIPIHRLGTAQGSVLRIGADITLRITEIDSARKSRAVAC